jgi:hypothetical protein
MTENARLEATELAVISSKRRAIEDNDLFALSYVILVKCRFFEDILITHY